MFLCSQYQLRTNVLRDQVVAGLAENGYSTDEGLILFAAMCAATVSVEEHEVKIYNMVSSTLHRVVLAVATVFLAATHSVDHLDFRFSPTWTSSRFASQTSQPVTTASYYTPCSSPDSDRSTSTRWYAANTARAHELHS